MSDGSLFTPSLCAAAEEAGIGIVSAKCSQNPTKVGRSPSKIDTNETGETEPRGNYSMETPDERLARKINEERPAPGYGNEYVAIPGDRKTDSPSRGNDRKETPDERLLRKVNAERTAPGHGNGYIATLGERMHADYSGTNIGRVGAHRAPHVSEKGVDAKRKTVEAAAPTASNISLVSRIEADYSGTHIGGVGDHRALPISGKGVGAKKRAVEVATPTVPNITLALPFSNTDDKIKRKIPVRMGSWEANPQREDPVSQENDVEFSRGEDNGDVENDGHRDGMTPTRENSIEAGSETPQTQFENLRFDEDTVLVTATLVNSERENNREQRESEPEVFAKAEKVLKRCYVGGKEVPWYFVASMVVVIVAVSVGVPVGLLLRDERPTPPVYPDGTCGQGSVGNCICADGSCCSPAGWCGVTPDHCVNFTCRIPVDDGNINRTIGPISKDKICGGFYPDWESRPSIPQIHPNYNLIYLFAARQNGATNGSISFTAPYEEYYEDIQLERKNNNRTFILSVGGSGHAFVIPNRAFSESLLESVLSMYDEVGGFDGLDWGNYGDGVEPSTEEMIWISSELKRLHPGFIISSSSRPYSHAGKAFCNDSIYADALDFCVPMFYNAPETDVPSSVLPHVRDWVELLGEKHVVIGLGINEERYFQSTSQALEIYNRTKATFPDIRGVTNWHISYDHDEETGFAEAVCTV